MTSSVATGLGNLSLQKERDHKTGTLFLGQEEHTMLSQQKGNQLLRSSIDPRVKAWIDNVIVPALIDEWRNNEGSEVAV